MQFRVLTKPSAAKKEKAATSSTQQTQPAAASTTATATAGVAGLSGGAAAGPPLLHVISVPSDSKFASTFLEKQRVSSLELFALTLKLYCKHAC